MLKYFLKEKSKANLLEQQIIFWPTVLIQNSETYFVKRITQYKISNLPLKDHTVGRKGQFSPVDYIKV